MSKIICDVCGTQYPESAEQCPICGRIRPAGRKTPSDDFVMESRDEESYTRVKGGRFSKSHVRKRNQDTPRYEMQQSKGHVKARDTYEEEFQERPPKGKPDAIINILLVVVILALLAVSAYIFMQFFLPNLMARETEPPTEPPVAASTAPATQEPTEYKNPCTALNIVDTEIRLEDEGQMYLLNVAVTPVDTTDTLSFASSDDSVVTVNEEGRLTAVGEGTADVTITCGEQTLLCVVTCQFTEPTDAPATEEPTQAPTEPPLKDVKLSVKTNDVTFKVKGQQATFKLTCGLKNNEVQWRSEDESIVKVDEEGVATAVGNGTTNVVVKYGDQELKIIVRCKLS